MVLIPMLTFVIILYTSFDVASPMVNTKLLKSTVKKANAALKSFDDMKQDWQPSKVEGRMGEKHPGFGFARIPSKSSLKAAKTANVLEIATKDLMAETSRVKRQTVEAIKAEFGSPFQLEVNAALLDAEGGDGRVEDEDGCPEESRKCLELDLSFRTLTGRCNSFTFPDFGAALQPLRRLLPARYADGVSQPRTKSSRSGIALPSAREVSLALHQEIDLSPDSDRSHAVMQWGQFIDHDLDATPQHRAVDGSSLNDICKPCDSASANKACLPIEKPEEASCLSFVRSLPGQQELGARQQINQITSYLDASMVYGSTACTAEGLRVANSALLRWSENPASPSDLLPLLPITKENADCRALDGNCFLAGDDRVNEQPGLTIFHTVLMREHNNIATELGKLNLHWGPDRLFLETRRIIGALIQHITYSEFLPRVLGGHVLDGFGLRLLPSGYYQGYDSDCSAAIFNEFATAAFRFGHSLIRPNMTLLTEDEARAGWDEGSKRARQVPLREVFHNPALLFQGQLDDLVRGIVMSPMMPMDRVMSPEVVDHLFEEPNMRRSGMDLAALNIQRGRDHGLPGYNAYRAVCGLAPATTFEELVPHISTAQASRMAKLYASTDDIDLFSGLISEKPLRGAMVGPTLACLVGLQFRHLRQCDRFWYEGNSPEVRFTSEQLRQVRRQSLSSLLCRNTDNVEALPRRAMDIESGANPLTACADLPKWDYQAWNELS